MIQIEMLINIYWMSLVKQSDKSMETHNLHVKNWKDHAFSYD